MYKELVKQLRSTVSRSKRTLFDDAADAIELLQKKEMSWISVEERLPKRTMPPKDVLVYHDLGCGMFIDRAWYSYEKNKWVSNLGMNLKVTHWMPLPEPPEEGSHDL